MNDSNNDDGMKGEDDDDEEDEGRFLYCFVELEAEEDNLSKARSRRSSASHDDWADVAIVAGSIAYYNAKLVRNREMCTPLRKIQACVLQRNSGMTNGRASYTGCRPVLTSVTRKGTLTDGRSVVDQLEYDTFECASGHSCHMHGFDYLLPIVPIWTWLLGRFY